MGLLDDVFNSPQGQLGIGLLAAAGPSFTPMGIGQRLAQAQDYVRSQQDAEMRKKLQEQQMQAAQLGMQNTQFDLEAKRQAAARAAQLQALPGQFKTSEYWQPDQPNPSLPEALQMGPQNATLKPAGFDFEGYSNALAQFDPEKSLAIKDALKKDDKPVVLPEGATLVSGHASGYKPIAVGQQKKDPIPSLVGEYNFARLQGEKRDFTTWASAMKKAGANNTTVSIAGPENKFNETVGVGLGKDALAVLDAARTAPDTVVTARSIRNAIDKGAITGTGAGLKLSLQKALETAGFVGPGKAATTQELMSGLSKLTLNGIKTSGLGGGQGFTDKDREFLNAAISGQIEDTPENLKRVATLSEKVAVQSHSRGKAILEKWAKDPALRNVSQTYSLDEIPAEAQWGIRKVQ